MSVILITGAGTGIGNLTARALARAGHRVYASMRSPAGRNAAKAGSLRELAVVDQLDLHVVELDVNTLGVQRLNRAALPYLREQGRGTLLYVGSTTSVTTPPFLGPYVVSKAAMDFLALVTSYEVGPLGIETVIVMPGAFTQGTDHFPKAGRPADATGVAEGYKLLDPLVARNEEATDGLFTPGTTADPGVVSEEIARILALPFGQRPLRSVLDLTNSDSMVEQANAAVFEARTDFVQRMGFGEVLHVGPA